MQTSCKELMETLLMCCLVHNVNWVTAAGGLDRDQGAGRERQAGIEGSGGTPHALHPGLVSALRSLPWQHCVRIAAIWHRSFVHHECNNVGHVATQVCGPHCQAISGCFG